MVRPSGSLAPLKARRALSGLEEPVRVEKNDISRPSASMTACELTEPTSTPTVMAEAPRQSAAESCQEVSLHLQYSPCRDACLVVAVSRVVVASLVVVAAPGLHPSGHDPYDVRARSLQRFAHGSDLVSRAGVQPRSQDHRVDIGR